MPTITQGNSAQVSLDCRQTCTVTTAGAASVRPLAGVPGAGFERHQVKVGQTLKVGPFAQPGLFSISAEIGDVTYSTDAPVPVNVAAGSGVDVNLAPGQLLRLTSTGTGYAWGTLAPPQPDGTQGQVLPTGDVREWPHSFWGANNFSSSKPITYGPAAYPQTVRIVSLTGTATYSMASAS